MFRQHSLLQLEILATEGLPTMKRFVLGLLCLAFLAATFRGFPAHAQDVPADTLVAPEEPLAEAELVAETVPEPEPAPLEQALAWAEEGLRAYRAGQLETARRHLTDARIVLLEADLPAVMQEKGLAVLNCCMPSELGGYDLRQVASQLDQALSPRTTDLSERGYVEAEVRRLLLLFDSHPSAAEMETLLSEVEMYIGFYRGHYRGFFERASARKARFWPLIEATFPEFNLPVELGYMALVESGFNPRAKSHANARGLFQFIPSTGRRYGLSSLEDFYDPEKSTRAAADYLRDLISIFGPRSVLLAMAGYNAGEGRIMGCLRSLDNPRTERSFWEIRPCLAPETREYVPRILAAAVLSSDPQRFGLTLGPLVADGEELIEPSQGAAPRPMAPREEIASSTRTSRRPTLTYTVKAGNTVESVAALFGVRRADLTSWNRLGSGRLRAGQRLTIHPPRQLVAKSHTVRRGETAGAIARRYGLATTQVLTANGLTPRTTIRPGQRLLVYVRG